MTDNNTETAEEGQPSGEVRPAKLFGDEPPKEQWAICRIKRCDKADELFKVPFTQEEIDFIERLLDLTRHPDLMKGFEYGGPEREYKENLQIPLEHSLDDRQYAIEMLRNTFRRVGAILEKNVYTPGLNSREPITAIRDALKPFFPTEDSN